MTQNSSPIANEHIGSKINMILNKMTLEQKFRILTSHGLHRFYSTRPIENLGINSFKMPDGPLGVAYHSSWKKNTRFPTTKALAASWNRSLAMAVGVAIAEEVRALNKHMILAPAVNIDRTPLNGRTFEYYSEDPFLTKEMAIQFVKGVQSLGVGACVKHFVANNQETNRRKVDAIIDERTLHEIYLRAFKEIIIHSEPYAVMACYNKVNGIYGCAHRELIRETLMQKWGFKGMVISDWFATSNVKSTADCVNAGLTLEMPWPKRYKTKNLKQSFANGEFSEALLDDLVRRNLRVFYLTGAIGNVKNLPSGSRNTPEHQKLARHVAEEGIVLLKNDGNLLPLDTGSIDSIHLDGPNLKKKFGKFLYGGSSAVVPPYEITPYDALARRLKDKVRIVKNPSNADISVIFAGLNHSLGMDSENRDRKTLKLPDKQIRLIYDTLDVNPNTIVVLISGSPITMNGWLERTPAILQAWYPGMEGGNAIANILFGEVSPSGKLPITFPMNIIDSPAHALDSPRTYPGDENNRVFYEEGILIGYRWFDAKGIMPLFPFGFGLSYTEFEIVDAFADKVSYDQESFIVNVNVRNTGQANGAEVIQLYSHQLEPTVPRPPNELVGFEKCPLAPDESVNLKIGINIQDLGYYDVDSHAWIVDRGQYELSVGNSSRNFIRTVQIEL